MQKTDAELRRSYLLFKALSYPLLIKLGPLATRVSLSLGLPIKRFMRSTFFGQFCGGETADECQNAIDRLKGFNVGTILDFATEASLSEEDFDRVQREVLATIDLAAKKRKSIPFAVFKPSGVGPSEIIEKRDRSLDLTPKEQQRYDRFVTRFQDLCAYAWKNDVRLFIDAEESWIQNSVDQLAQEMMLKFNKDKAIIYNTIQLYRKDRLEFLKGSYAAASSRGYILGVKLVRGAYMEKEAKKAAAMGYSNPIHSSKEATDQSYNLALRFCLEHHERIALCAGTHNERSTLLLSQFMEEFNLENNNHHIYFAQLLGMSDNLTFNLAHHNYNVCKYMPYGKLGELVPYLSRRAEENSSIRGQTGRELSLIKLELERRQLNES